MPPKEAKQTQVAGKQKKTAAPEDSKEKKMRRTWDCDMVPLNVPRYEKATKVLHPKKDVFVLKVAKVGPKGDRKCKMELELITPKGPSKKIHGIYQTRETQCETPCECYCCGPCGAKRTKN